MLLQVLVDSSEPESVFFWEPLLEVGDESMAVKRQRNACCFFLLTELQQIYKNLEQQVLFIGGQRFIVTCIVRKLMQKTFLEHVFGDVSPVDVAYQVFNDQQACAELCFTVKPLKES